MKKRVMLASGQGFTIVELMVTIAIITVLSTVLFVSMNSSRANARDAKRMADIRQIGFAMNLYGQVNFQFPITFVSDTKCSLVNSLARFDSNKFNKIENYLDPIPTDPGSGEDENCNNMNGSQYLAIDNTNVSNKFCICAKLEQGNFFCSSEKGTKEIGLSSIPLNLTDHTCW